MKMDFLIRPIKSDIINNSIRLLGSLHFFLAKLEKFNQGKKPDKKTTGHMPRGNLIFLRDIKDGIYFQAGDQSILCELLHPDRQGLPPDRQGLPLQMGFSLAHAKVKPGQSTLIHKLSTSAEIFFILEGEGIIHIEQESASIHPGLVVYIPPNKQQFIQNTGTLDLTLLCMVYPQWRKEDEVIY